MGGIIETHIEAIELHLYSSPLMTFHNTLYKEILTKYASPAVFSVTTHHHLLIPLGHLPLIVINHTEVISGSKIKDFLKSLLVASNKENIMIQPIIQLSEELATVVQYLSEHASNPYYLLISPLKKLEFYLWRKKIQTDFESCSQCIDDNLLNKHYFFHKLRSLICYIECYGGKISDLPPLAVMCLYSLIKTVRINRKEIYDIMCENEILSDAEKEGLELINRKEEGRRLPKSIFMLEEGKEKGEKVEKGNMKISIIKSVMATTILALTCLSFKTT